MATNATINVLLNQLKLLSSIMIIKRTLKVAAMKVTSRTGLIPSKTNKLIKPTQPEPIQFKVVAIPAPYVLKPYAGLYSPYPYGCSLLCNHPADNEARELVKKAKDTWATEGKNLLLAEEIEAIKASFTAMQVKITDYDNINSNCSDDQLPLGCVPEELFRRYTETDSRPLTPAPTLASAHTRASGSRRCVTPDPMSATQVREKTMLVLDLRRSHSQETISWHSSSLLHRENLPSITIVKATTERRSISALNFSEISETPRKKKDLRSSTTPSPTKIKAEEKLMSKSRLSVHSDNYSENENESTDDEDVIKRRGRKRRKRGRDSSHDPPGIQSSVDPETQIETIGPDSHNPSARPSLVPTEALTSTEIQNALETEAVKSKAATPKIRRSSLSIDSYLDINSLKLLRRELNEEVIDNEFNQRRRQALEEALKTVRRDKPICNEILELQKELQLVPVDENVWVNIPRTFSRSSARFELPMDSRKFSSMTPLEYAKEYVFIISSRKQLYNFIFNRNKVENDLENEHQRHLCGKNIPTALNEIMGKSMTEKQMSDFRELIGWEDEDVLDFQTFSGLCAICERLLAPEYYPNLPNRKLDPCHEIESVDFQSLERRLIGQNTDPRVVKILYAIKDL